jgi:hypothetical protein
MVDFIGVEIPRLTYKRYKHYTIKSSKLHGHKKVPNKEVNPVQVSAMGNGNEKQDHE